MTLPALIAQLTAATAGSRELDADIYEALGCEVIRMPRNGRGYAWKYRGQGPSGRIADRWESMQELSTSLDAAMTLVPEGWLTSDVSQDLPDNWLWTLTKLDSIGNQIGFAQGERPTAPLAICLASLRAIESMKRRTE
jgi:hypothetical protein